MIESYTDAYLIIDSQDVKSTSGFAFMSGGAAISWGSNKHYVIARSLNMWLLEV